jgi:hypothetical protein
VEKIVYQRINISDTYQRLMKMVECMEDEAHAHPKGETKSRITQKNLIGPNCENKCHNKHKWGQGKPGCPSDKVKLVGKESLVKKVN